MDEGNDEWTIRWPSLCYTLALLADARKRKQEERGSGGAASEKIARSIDVSVWSTPPRSVTRKTDVDLAARAANMRNPLFRMMHDSPVQRRSTVRPSIGLNCPRRKGDDHAERQEAKHSALFAMCSIVIAASDATLRLDVTRVYRLTAPPTRSHRCPLFRSTSSCLGPPKGHIALAGVVLLGVINGGVIYANRVGSSRGARQHNGCSSHIGHEAHNDTCVSSSSSRAFAQLLLTFSKNLRS
ncbi:uncharacterized protein LAESUDRAFT_712757 [Laetiporus sulphureus 93-53]|uniref:Uncharacterized protein n=1 Tax=Laetiporus sulphureus 93-53 TaxID=1314785 RepID=A0A165FAQ8_9APHY|nr:uncharacterized protein LAESUDRAFT_712757 [Laetiporus sulphureus 93-53]KZT08684.1 hypothetical protein LAESUDRAFT_712757 [Laetiporus sulphureus 93-53]